MCSIFGWMGKGIKTGEKLYLIKKATERGRDGFGLEADGKTYRGLDSNDIPIDIYKAENLVGNFRATPTTEEESNIDNLQPYAGIVHNGIIANDKEFGDFPIDSMCLPTILGHQHYRTFEELIGKLSKIKGSYALAYFDMASLHLACNYKPIYYSHRKDGFMFASTPDMLPFCSTPMDAYSTMRVYHYGNELKITKIPIYRHQNKKVAISASSGLDSTVVAYILKNQGYEVTLVHFLYGCLAETKEQDRIYRIADQGGFGLQFVEMPKGVMAGSITDGVYHKNGIEGAEFAEDWVSARNLLMLSILTAFAESNGFGYIAFGGNLEESGAFPDNEQEFGRRFNAILPYATQNGVKIELLQPLSTFMKHEIVKIGTKLNVPFDLTWSCYDKKDHHCGKCGPCFMRKKAFERNGLIDPVFSMEVI